MAKADTKKPQNSKETGTFIFAFIASLMLLASIFLVNAEKLIFSPDFWVKQSEAVLSSPEAVSALSVYLVDELFGTVDVEQQIKNVLPLSGDFLAPGLTSQLKEYSVKLAERVLQSDRVEAVWGELSTQASNDFVSEIQGRTLANDGQVTISFGELLLKYRDELGTIGQRLFDRANFSQRGVVTILSGPQVFLIRNYLSYLSALAVSITLGSVLFFILALSFAKNIFKSLVIVGSFISLSSIFLVMGLPLLRSWMLGQISGPVAMALIGTFWDTITVYLKDSASYVLIAGLLLILSGYFFNPASKFSFAKLKSNRK